MIRFDQPAVGEASLHRLIRAWRRRPGKAAAAAYAGVVGVPAILPGTLWREARRLRGDEGARKLLRMKEMPATAVHMPEAAWDIDTPEDLQRIPNGIRFPRQGSVGHGQPSHG